MPTFTISVNTKPLGAYVVKKSVVSIGRSRTNTISIASKAVSRNHVRIEYGAEGWSLSDLGSLNGTYVNDIRITSASLSDGDKITVGAYSILFSPQPLPSTSQGDGHVSDVTTDDSDGSDTDVRLESASAMENPNDSGDAASDDSSEEIPPPQQTTSIPVIGENPETKSPSGNSALTLQEKVKLVISENPLADDFWIKNRLAEGDFGEQTMSKQKLMDVLKEMNLETQIKRYQYFMHS